MSQRGICNLKITMFLLLRLPVSQIIKARACTVHKHNPCSAQLLRVSSRTILSRSGQVNYQKVSWSNFTILLIVKVYFGETNHVHINIKMIFINLVIAIRATAKYVLVVTLFTPKLSLKFTSSWMGDLYVVWYVEHRTIVSLSPFFALNVPQVFWF